MKAMAPIVVIALAARASAEPQIDLARCTAFDRRALARAIDRELPELRDRHFAVIVECPDLVTAHIHVEPVPADGPIARSLDLGEVPGDLRLKLLALAVAELVEVAAKAAPSASAPTVPVAAPRRFGDPRDPQAFADAEPRAGTPRPTAPSTVDVAPRPTTRVAAIAPPGETSVDVTVPRERPPRWTIAPVLGMRLYASTRTALADAGAELGLRWLRVGIRGAIGRSTDALGTMRPWLAAVTATRELACAGWACALVRVEAGVAGVTAHAVASTTVATSATHGYADAMLAGELTKRFRGWTGTASVDAGWAEGLIARAGGRDAVSLAGAVVIGAIGARWP
jgi:hypothetical protein